MSAAWIAVEDRRHDVVEADQQNHAQQRAAQAAQAAEDDAAEHDDRAIEIEGVGSGGAGERGGIQAAGHAGQSAAMASNKGRSRVHAVAYAAVLSMVIYLIVDLEFPRMGLIRINGVDWVMVEMRQRMN